MGKRRVRCLKALGYSDIIGFDLRADRRTEAAEKYGIATTGDWAAAAAQRVDAWIISTPPDTHSGYGLQAVGAGAAFFTEANVDEPETPQLIVRLEQTGIVGAPSCTMRYHAGPRAIKAAVADGRIGKPLAFTYHSGQYLPDWHPWESYTDFYVSKKQTGACREIVPFELSWLVDVFGEVRDLRCLKAKVTDLRTDIDDVYQVLASFDGTIGHLMVDVVAQPAVRQFRLLGSEGTLVWDQTARTVAIWTAVTQTWETTLLTAGTIEPGYAHSEEEPYVAEMADFVAAVRGERPWPYSYADDGRVLALLLRAERDSAEALVS
jgi:predicted dehydrogenase